MEAKKVGIMCKREQCGVQRNNNTSLQKSWLIRCIIGWAPLKRTKQTARHNDTSPAANDRGVLGPGPDQVPQLHSVLLMLTSLGESHSQASQTLSIFLATQGERLWPPSFLCHFTQSTCLHPSCTLQAGDLSRMKHGEETKPCNSYLDAVIKTQFLH